MTVADTAISTPGTRRALVTLSGVLFLTFLDTTIMSVALQNLQETLHTTVSEMQWIVNAYALLFASLMLAFGSLGDRLGRKRVMLGGVVVFIAGSLFGAMAPNTASLIAARGIMGIGAAACEPGTLSILRHLYPDRSARARALGVWAAIAGLALAMGPVVGGIMVGLGGWPAIFWFNVAAGVLALAAAQRTIPESSDPETGRFDFAGFILGPTALGTIVFAIIVGETTGYTSAPVLALFAIGFVAGGLFVAVEHRSQGADAGSEILQETRILGIVVRCLCGLLRGVLHLLPDRALPSDRGRLFRLPHRHSVRPHGTRDDHWPQPSRARGWLVLGHACPSRSAASPPG